MIIVLRLIYKSNKNILHNKMSDLDNINITKIGNQRYYETKELKEKKCTSCNKNFRHKIHGNKRWFDTKEFAFYKLYIPSKIIYLHFECFVEFLDKHYSNRALLFEKSKISKIDLCDSRGVKLYKKNYIRDIKKLLNKFYNEKFCKDDRLLECFSFEDRFSFHCVDVSFRSDKLEIFENIKNEYNEKYRNKGISIKMTPKDVENFLG